VKQKIKERKEWERERKMKDIEISGIEIEEIRRGEEEVMMSGYKEDKGDEEVVTKRWVHGRGR